jgi:hypothetical protein
MVAHGDPGDGLVAVSASILTIVFVASERALHVVHASPGVRDLHGNGTGNRELQTLVCC